MKNLSYDVIVIGGGPAGMAAALKANSTGAKVILLDREEHLGGILKQCIHDGFGLIRFHRQLTGPSYAERFIDQIKESSIAVQLQCFVFDIKKMENGSFLVFASSRDGVLKISSSAVVVATGCRERTSRQVFIQGDRVSGIFNAGCIQNLVNLKGFMPGARCAILGSGDIGLIMARRLTLEGAKVIGVFEAKKTPSGLERNIRQCLKDFSIPLHLGCTVTRTFGERRLQAIEVADTDDRMGIIESTKRRIEVDALIISVGLIPEIELLKKLDVKINNLTRGPVIDQYGMTSISGLFCTGNASLVYDLVDYVSMQAEATGLAAAGYACNGTACDISVEVKTQGKLLFVNPSFVRLTGESVDLFFRVSEELDNQKVLVMQEGILLTEKEFPRMRPPQMERIQIKLKDIRASVPLSVVLKEACCDN